jgi:hypothetical protein
MALENGEIGVMDTDKLEIEFTKAHSARVKSVQVVGEHLASVSTAGQVKLWKRAGAALTELHSFECSGRATALAAWAQ